jgi:hypothetical protein
MISIFRRLLTKGQRKPSPRGKNYFRPRLEALEERWSPAVDIWNPAPGNILWSNALNWSLNRVPGINDTATFDPTQGRQLDCEVDIPGKVGALVFQVRWLNTMILDAVTLESTGSAGFTNGGNTVNINFTSTSSKLQLDGGGSLSDFSFRGARGTVAVTGGTLSKQQAGTGGTSSDFIISNTATLSIGGVITFTGGAGITIASGASMIIQPLNTTVLSDNNGGGIIENWGTVTWNGQGGNTTEIDMAFLNHNTATFANTFAALKFGHSSQATNGYSVMMDNGLLTLNTFMQTPKGYYQTGGTLTGIAGDIDFLKSGSVAELDGGVVKTGMQPAGTFLIFENGNVNFHGAELDVRLDPAANVCDNVFVKVGNLDITAASTLKTTWLPNRPPLQKPRAWTVLGAGLINGNFTQDFTATPGVSGPDPNRLPTNYVLLA